MHIIRVISATVQVAIKLIENVSCRFVRFVGKINFVGKKIFVDNKQLQ